MRLLQEMIGEEDSCVYLPAERSRTHYRIIDGCKPEVYSAMLHRGWRRFGRVFFRPVCRFCSQCRSLRIPVRDFRPNRSMRRNEKANRDLETVLLPVSLTPDHLRLYERYHLDMSGRKGWPGKGIDPLDYFQTFIDGHESYGHELRILLDGRLVGLALVDLLPDALSAVYCFYDPDLRSRGLGVFSILRQIEIARQRGLPNLFLGFWVKDNASMRYKANYQPHEILRGRPGSEEDPVWVRNDRSSTLRGGVE